MSSVKWNAIQIMKPHNAIWNAIRCSATISNGIPTLSGILHNRPNASTHFSMIDFIIWMLLILIYSSISISTFFDPQTHRFIEHFGQIMSSIIFVTFFISVLWMCSSLFQIHSVRLLNTDKNFNKILKIDGKFGLRSEKREKNHFLNIFYDYLKRNFNFHIF